MTVWLKESFGNIISFYKTFSIPVRIIIGFALIGLTGVLGVMFLKWRSAFLSLMIVFGIVILLDLFFFPRIIKKPQISQEEKKVFIAVFSAVVLLLFFILNFTETIIPEVLSSFLQWLALLGFAFYIWIISPEKSQKPIEITSPKPRLLEIGILVTILGLFFFFAMQHLGQFVTVDEPKWLFSRIPQYFDALLSGDFKGTYINDKPGVISVLLAGIPYLAMGIRDKILSATPAEMETILVWLRLPSVIFVGINLVGTYILSRRLFKSSLWSLLLVFLLSTTPILLGISQVINPDATVWILGINAILAFFVVMNSNKRRFIFLAGIYLGLALLSKFFAQILILMFIGYLLLSYLQESRHEFLFKLRKTILIVLISCMTFALLFPYSITNTYVLFEGTIFNHTLLGKVGLILIPTLLIWILDLEFLNGRLRSLVKKYKLSNLLAILLLIVFSASFMIVLANALGIIDQFDWQEYFHDSGKRKDESRIAIYFSSFAIQMFVLTVPVLVFSIGVFFKWLHKLISNKGISKMHFSLLALFLIYIAGPAIGNFIPVPRYEILLFPVSILFAVLFVKSVKPVLLRNALIVVLVLWNLVTIFLTAPFYFSYANELHYEKFTSDSWGFGAYEASTAVNATYDHDLKVWADREGFCEFSELECFTKPINPFCRESNIDLVVLSKFGQLVATSREDLYLPELQYTWDQYYSTKQPELTVQAARWDAYTFNVFEIDPADKIEVCPIIDTIDFDTTLLFEKYGPEIVANYLGLFTNFPEYFYDLIVAYDPVDFDVQKYRRALGNKVAIQDLENLRKNSSDGWILILNLPNDLRKYLNENSKVFCEVEQIDDLSIYRWGEDACYWYR